MWYKVIFYAETFGRGLALSRAGAMLLFSLAKKVAKKATPHAAEGLPLMRRGAFLFESVNFYVNLNCRYSQCAVTTVA